MTKFRRFLTQHHNEHGSDLVVTLFLLPFVIALLFTGIEVSTYFQTKTQVTNVTRDGARMVALMGGTSPTITLNRERFGGTGQNVTTYVRNKIVDPNGNCRFSGCVTPPVITCGPSRASNLGQDAYCTVNYKYRSFAGGLVGWLGFDNIVNKPIIASERFKVETAW